MYSKSRVVSDRPGGYAQTNCIWLRTGRSGFDPRQEQRIFLLVPASRPALGPTQPNVQWVPGVLSPGVKRGRGVTLTTYPHLVSRLRMSRSYTSSPPCASMACSGTALLYLTVSKTDDNNNSLIIIRPNDRPNITFFCLLDFLPRICLVVAKTPYQVYCTAVLSLSNHIRSNA
jgi:hypothetical protein